MPGPPTHRRLVTTLVLAIAAAAVAAACQPVVEVTDPGPGAPVNRLVVGISHTESTIGAVTPEEPRSVELAVLAQVPVQNVFLMGWGTANPEPTPGQFDWSTLDDRIDLIDQAGAEPVLTLCCAPDWMKGQPEGTTDWGLLTVAPEPGHYDDFAALAAAAAVRYPQVTRFQVWNEMKGFYDPATNAWDSAAYTELYNRVYRAIKAVRPDAQVGGPYAPLDLWADPDAMSHPSDLRGPWGVVDQRPLDVLEHWLAHNEGADFVTLDGWITTRDQGLVTDVFTAAQVFAAVTRWVRARTDLPVWWSEVHVGDPAWSLELQDAVTTVALTTMAQAGASVALLWSPQADGHGCAGCLWTDPDLGPVVATPLSRSVAAWAGCAPVGTRWLDATSSASGVVAAAATESGTFVVNRSAADLPVTVGTATVTLPAHGVAVSGPDPGCRR
jgi:hypothetical protein